MDEISDYKIKFSNKSTKRVTGVLFASESSSSETLCSAWAVFNEAETSLSLPRSCSIGFHYLMNGENHLSGPFECEPGSLWNLDIFSKDDDNSLAMLQPSAGIGIIIIKIFFFKYDNKVIMNDYLTDHWNLMPATYIIIAIHVW